VSEQVASATALRRRIGPDGADARDTRVAQPERGGEVQPAGREVHDDFGAPAGAGTGLRSLLRVGKRNERSDDFADREIAERGGRAARRDSTHRRAELPEGTVGDATRPAPGQRRVQPPEHARGRVASVHEPLVQIGIVFVVQRDAPRGRTIPPGTTRLLVVAFEASGELPMRHEAHVGAVHSHAEWVRCLSAVST
jgi:hypothetical protein